MKTTDRLSPTTADALLSLISVFSILFILPRFGEFAMAAGCAFVLTIYVGRTPDRFRSRHGSLKLAFCLMAFLWILAGIVGGLSLLGQL